MQDAQQSAQFGRPKRGQPDAGPHPVDRHVGERLRLRRTMLGLSQMSLAHSLELSFQQIHKYERGRNRLSASALFAVASALEVPVSFFFDDMPPDVAKTAPPPIPAEIEGRR